MEADATLRDAEAGDADRVRELVESSMTTSYALSPQGIETILEAEFDADPLGDRFDDAETVARVAEGEETLVGYGEATVAGDAGLVRWVHVDPERRGAGVGTALFERLTAAVDDRGVDEVRAVTLADNTAGGAFVERFDFEKTGERTTEFDDRETVQHVYVEEGATGAADETGAAGSAADADSASDAGESPSGQAIEGALPDAVATDDGTEVHPGGDPIAGAEGAFVRTFTDADRSEHYGYYCTNCGSTAVSMDESERLECADCGNTHRPEEYDGSYL
ncbi:GNAT family N-acetyltransferase [Halosimplex pelagicum]|uniref:GNAT family N-acetyltransferase n=1 Tax=Halosimplex pelagicum TaxID=869886 RepID=A0A7D5PAA0_9EURY|nr:GNAT family N-acetyltransferase [Halosimplex pelagicum]QLH84617.1 GNAT family N-acetyltransferase [Halosimplex pelagicum]